jgi:hypothetical protein
MVPFIRHFNNLGHVRFASELHMMSLYVEVLANKVVDIGNQVLTVPSPAGRDPVPHKDTKS